MSVFCPAPFCRACFACLFRNVKIPADSGDFSLIGAQNLLCRLCLLARQFFDHQRLQRQHREQENQIAGKAEPAQNRKDDVGGNKRQRAQPHPQIKVVLFPENGGNNVRTGSVKDDDDEVEDKKCNKSEQTDKNDGPVDNGPCDPSFSKK